uniref:Uncharacterized protein n=1 Tax=Pithovirus LCPAC101 TaxID=2506586 RepID=A0A481Z536_9VIRU|nr:MAG: hypothetical protein LCPAC101_00330 [Pithovirus LCPAC101]
METKVNEKIVWLRSGKSKYLFDRSNGMKINYFRSTMDEKYGAKEYIGNILFLSIDAEFEPILKHITDYIDGKNNTTLYNKRTYKLLLKFIDFIQDDGMYVYIFRNIIQHINIEKYSYVINKIMKNDNIQWLDCIENFNTKNINIKNLKYILKKYYQTFNNFEKIYRCALLWDQPFYTAVFECLYGINKESIEYVNINNVNENSKLIEYKLIHLNII